jgi:uncharacterized DUF497 family protein
MRFHFDKRKSERLRANPKRGIGFEEAQDPDFLLRGTRQRPRVRLSVRKAAWCSPTPQTSTGNPGETFRQPYYLDQRSDQPEQYRAIGWVGERLYAVILEMRNDEVGEFYHLVTLWKATRQEQELYEEHS